VSKEDTMNNPNWMLYLSPQARCAEERRYREELAAMWGRPILSGLGSRLRRPR
jgi:hypothetical protein